MTVTFAELSAFVGRTGTYRTSEEGFEIPVRVVNARPAGLFIEVEVEPVTGAGRAWVPAKKVSFPEPAGPTAA